MPQDLDSLRQKIQSVDREIVDLMAQRMDLARRVGEAKAERGLPIRDFATEKRVIERMRGHCRGLGIDEGWGEAIAKRLIQGAVKAQEDLPGAHPPGTRQSVLIIGGSGKMGQWLARFFDSQGHPVSIHDPAPSSSSDEEFAQVDLARAEDFDVIVVATPLAVSASVLSTLRALRPSGLIFDICSLKEPVRAEIHRAFEEGLKITSLHPMFGAGVELLSGRAVLLCDCGHQRANDEARALFAETTLTVRDIDLDEHDELMGALLGFGHALSIIAFTAIARFGWSLEDLLAGASTTFIKLVRTIAEVARENPHLYYEIQKLNLATPKVYSILEEAVTEVRNASLAEDSSSFMDLMRHGREIFESIDFATLPANFSDPI